MIVVIVKSKKPTIIEFLLPSQYLIFPLKGANMICDTEKTLRITLVSDTVI